ALRVPQSGNKLLTQEFIPAPLSTCIARPEIVYRSREGVLPQNGDIESGVYYMKANHGSGFVAQVRFPMLEERRALREGQARAWLKRSYGLTHGEWWYNTFKREIFLERSVNGKEPAQTWLFYVVNGEIAYISIDDKIANRCAWLDADFARL